MLPLARPVQVFGWKCAEGAHWHTAEAVCPGERSCGESGTVPGAAERRGFLARMGRQR